jgi:4-hydroxy-3-polyprenylbenzoate decarboxylase
MSNEKHDKASNESSNDALLSRRDVVLTGAALAAAPGAIRSAAAASRKKSAGSGPQPPFDTLRDYADALEQAGLLARFDGVNQDKYEATAIMYQLVDEFGLREAPAVMFENITVNGRRYPTPVISNPQGNINTEALLLGVEPDARDINVTYEKVTRKMLDLFRENDGQWPEIPTREVSAGQALCKQVVLTGDDVDATAFPFMRGNPGDAGPYINTASVVTTDETHGVNYGIYRCQLKGPRKIMINFEGGQTGIKAIRAAKKRGETTVPVCLVIGQDPMTWMVSASRVPSRIGNDDPMDELAIAGGFRGKAIDVVRSENGKFLVPANAEIVIEGTVDMYNLEPEGPYHEMYGYLGHPKDNFVFTADTLTHRKDAWIMNSFTGVIQEYIDAPQRAESIYRLQQSHPQVVDFASPYDTQGIIYISIKKDAPRQAFEVARPLAMFNPLARVVIVVDDDVDVLDQSAIRFAIATRWQPALASEIIENRPSFPLDPASPDRKTTSKIIIDATRQWPEEGGPEVYQRLNRDVFQEAFPDAIAQVTARWPELLVKN